MRVAHAHTNTRVCVSSRDEFPRAFLRAPRNCSDFSTELPQRRWPRGWRNFSGFLAAREIGHEKGIGGREVKEEERAERRDGGKRRGKGNISARKIHGTPGRRKSHEKNGNRVNRALFTRYHLAVCNINDDGAR